MHAKKENTIKLEYISIILTGRCGLGKSTLINSLLKGFITPISHYNVATIKTMTCKSEIIPFLNLTDTRGYGFEDINMVEKEVLDTIQYKKENKTFTEKIKGIWNYLFGNETIENTNFNEHIQCIWFCVNANSIDQSEIKALTENKAKR